MGFGCEMIGMMGYETMSKIRSGDKRVPVRANAFAQKGRLESG